MPRKRTVVFFLTRTTRRRTFKHFQTYLIEYACENARYYKYFVNFSQTFRAHFISKASEEQEVEGGEPLI